MQSVGTAPRSRARSRLSRRRADAPQTASTITQIQLGCLYAVLRDDHRRSIDRGPRPARPVSAWLADTAVRFEQRSARTGNRAERRDAGQLPGAGRRCGRRARSRARRRPTPPSRSCVSSVTSLAPSDSRNRRPDPAADVAASDRLPVLLRRLAAGAAGAAVDHDDPDRRRARPAAPPCSRPIWQVQVGCLAWCWNSTQLQQASSEHDRGRDEPAVRGRFGARTGTRTRSCAGARAGAGVRSAGGGEWRVDPGARGAAPAPIPAVAALSPTPANRVGGAVIRVLASPRRSGAAILTSWSVTGVPAPARRGGSCLEPAPGEARHGRVGSGSKSERACRRTAPAPRPTQARRPSRRASPPQRSRPTGVSLEADLPLLLILAILLALTVRRRAYR